MQLNSLSIRMSKEGVGLLIWASQKYFFIVKWAVQGRNFRFLNYVFCSKCDLWVKKHKELEDD